MMRKHSGIGRAFVASVVLLAVLFVAGPARSADDEWGTVKGRIVFADKIIPANGLANVDKDKEHCLSKGDILKNEFVVNKKNKGIRWALVWLTGVDDPKGTKPIPIHPSLEKMPKSMSIDQPCCQFEPRVLGMREGQSLVIKNTSPIPHNTNMNGGTIGPTINPLVPSKGQYTVEKMKARALPLLYTCSIHSWMKGYIGVFKHPYFAVTDGDGNFTFKNAPAVKYRLMAWHEQGWVFINHDQGDTREQG